MRGEVGGVWPAEAGRAYVGRPDPGRHAGCGGACPGGA